MSDRAPDDMIERDPTETGAPRLSAALEVAAEAADDRAAAAIRDGDPEAAARSLRLAEHLRRLATHHAAERLLTGDDADDPRQLS